MAWEHFLHGADIGVRGTGSTRGEAFEQAALALTAVVTDPTRVSADTTIEVHCEAPDDELLLCRLAECAGLRNGDAQHAVWPFRRVAS